MRFFEQRIDASGDDGRSGIEVHVYIIDSKGQYQRRREGQVRTVSDLQHDRINPLNNPHNNQRILYILFAIAAASVCVVVE